ncbi:hypothetical protein ACE6H2_007311 [Prunus campanulata]
MPFSLFSGPIIIKETNGHTSSSSSSSFLFPIFFKSQISAAAGPKLNKTHFQYANVNSSELVWCLFLDHAVTKCDEL